MSDPRSVDSFCTAFDRPISASGNWSFGRGSLDVPQASQAWHPSALKDIGIAMVFAISPITTAFAPLNSNGRANLTISTGTTLQTARRRRITAREALRLAQEILHRAEAGRAAIVDQEARWAVALEYVP